MTRSASLAVLTAVAISWVQAGSVRAENVDPGNAGSQYVYAENVGWINARPAGAGGPGMQVDDFELTGWMWGENIGWISLSCKNTASCATVEYGVDNDGSGVLSGYAWTETIGWVSFAPPTAGVFVDPSTGEFSGHAWAENAGWIAMASNGADPYKLETGWSCAPPPAVPSGSPTLALDKSGADSALSWGDLAGATGYDVIRGDLGALRNPLDPGDFATATEACVDSNRTSTSISLSGDPAPGEGVWFLVRGSNCGGDGSYDTGEASQTEPRDVETAASGGDCPG